MPPSVKLSVVVPLCDEREVFPELLRRLKALGPDCELIFVDDGSADGTRELIAKACAEDGRCRGILLSRNFGHQIAVTAGMQAASGDAIAIIDGDLQDPPELIHEFLKRLDEGHDIVYAVRESRKEGLPLRAAYALFYRLLRHLSAVPIPLDSGDFCVMNRRAAALINSLPERHRFLRGLRAWIGLRQSAQPYSRQARAGGRPKYTLSKLLGLAFEGIFTFSERPLQWSMQIGFLVALSSFAWASYVIYWRLFSGRGDALPGWATLAVAVLFLGGVQLISIGILGEYIGRIHNEVKGRPLYVVDKRLGFPSN